MLLLGWPIVYNMVLLSVLFPVNVIMIRNRLLVLAKVSASAFFLAAAPQAGAQTVADEIDGTVRIDVQAEPQDDPSEEYWNQERMDNAQPLPFPGVVAPDSDLSVEPEQTVIPEPPGFAPGWSPDSGAEQPATDEGIELLDLNDAEIGSAMPLTYGSAPSNPKNGPYGPFQRWSMQGKYNKWPRFVHGKLFFQKPDGRNYVCSATVINRSTLATAGHCVASNKQWYKSFRFCPGYIQSGPHPAAGCWDWSSFAATTGNWFNNGDVDYDVACLVTRTTGTVISNKVGNVTGWVGRAWNFGAEQPLQQFGYPQGAPFDGKVIQQVATTQWYEVDMVAGGQKSVYTGSDLTGGSSGGGHFLSWRHPATEFPDTDSNPNTDPYGAQNGPYITGVNSHSRCRSDCGTPPTTTAGVFWQEMGSPPFKNTAAGGESEDVFAKCLDHANN